MWTPQGKFMSFYLFRTYSLMEKGFLRCRYEDSSYYAKLLLVMEFYSKHVLPSCPTKNGCQCFIENIQVNLTNTQQRIFVNLNVNLSSRKKLLFPLNVIMQSSCLVQTSNLPFFLSYLNIPGPWTCLEIGY
jgi:hypothetical protein